MEFFFSKKASSTLIYKLTKKRNGFSSILLLTILPLFTLIIFSIAFTFYFIQTKVQLRSVCLSHGVELEKKLVQSEKKLFKLNNVSNMLRTQLLQAYILLAAATASENYAEAAKIFIEIQKIKSKQSQLDRTQKLIIESANTIAMLDLQMLQQKIQEDNRQRSSTWNFYLKNLFNIQLQQSPRLAVHPDSDDVAPNYELDSDYKQTQRLVYKSQLFFYTSNEAQRILLSNTFYSSTCELIPHNDEGEKWHIEINMDKF